MLGAGPLLRVAIVLSSLIAATLAACSRGEVREWTPADHDQEESVAQQPGAVAGAQRQSPAEEAAQLVDIAWERQCATCHGMRGRGDGPNGPMVNAPDLTQAEWQSSVTDAQIASVITQGKGRMPRFELPPAVIDGLVQRVRQIRAR